MNRNKSLILFFLGLLACLASNGQEFIVKQSGDNFIVGAHRFSDSLLILANTSFSNADSAELQIRGKDYVLLKRLKVYLDNGGLLPDYFFKLRSNYYLAFRTINSVTNDHAGLVCLDSALRIKYSILFNTSFSQSLITDVNAYNDSLLILSLNGANGNYSVPVLLNENTLDFTMASKSITLLIAKQWETNGSIFSTGLFYETFDSTGLRKKVALIKYDESLNLKWVKTYLKTDIGAFGEIVSVTHEPNSLTYLWGKRWAPKTNTGIVLIMDQAGRVLDSSRFEDIIGAEAVDLTSAIKTKSGFIISLMHHDPNDFFRWHAEIVPITHSFQKNGDSYLVQKPILASTYQTTILGATAFNTDMSILYGASKTPNTNNQDGILLLVNDSLDFMEGKLGRALPSYVNDSFEIIRIKIAESKLIDISDSIITKDTLTSPMILSGTKINLESLLQVFPNPAKSKLIIESAEDLVGSHIEIISWRGEIIWKGHIKTTSDTIDLSSYSPGTYVFRITNSSGSVSKTILIQ